MLVEYNGTTSDSILVVPYIRLKFIVKGTMLFKYKEAPSEFEVQSCAYGILKSTLSEEYCVRGEYKLPYMRADICIWKKSPEGHQLILVIEVKKNPYGTATRQGERYENICQCPCIYVRGFKDAYEILDLVQPYL